MPFDEEEIDVHGECAAEIKRLKAVLSHIANCALTPDTAKSLAFRFRDEAREALAEKLPCDDCSSFDFSCTGKCLEPK